MDPRLLILERLSGCDAIETSFLFKYNIFLSKNNKKLSFI